MDEPITVLIVDDHAVVRHGIRALLEAEGDFLVVGEASSGGQAVLLAADLAPDVVLMDLVMPEIDGVEATRLLKQRSPRSQVIVLTSYHGMNTSFRQFAPGRFRICSKVWDWRN